MPAWKKVIVSGSDASLKTLQVSNSVTASIISGSQFTGSLFGTASFARNSISASYVRNLYITASSTAPISPTDNELWYDADNGKTYIRYNDGTSTQWVLQSDPTIDVNTSLQTLQEVTDLGNTTTNTVSITNTTNATDSSSGAFIVDGGAGFGLDVWARKFYGDGSALTGVVAASIVEVDTLQTVTTRGTNTSASIFITNTTNATNAGVGALRVSGGLYVGLDIWAKGITSSLEGTASWARNSNSASFVTGSIFTAGNLALSSSFATTSSFSRTASFVEFTNIANRPTLFSGSSQVKIEEISGSVFADRLYTFPGDIVVQGNVTAEQLIVSSSVYFVTTSFSSGSTIFGNDTTDNHRFTGSLFITGAAFISGSTQVTGSFRVLGGMTATSLTGSITASSLVGDIILGTQTSGQYASTITGGSGLTATAANATDGTAYTIDAVAGAGISLTAPTNDAINIDTGSAHFTGGVTNRLNTLNVLSGSVSSPSQGTVSVGGFTNIDLGLQTGDNVTFNTITATNGLTGSLTASSLIGDIRLGTQTSGDYVATITAGNGLASTGATTGENISHTLSVNAGSGISVTAPTADAVNLDTGSVHFLDGVKAELNTEGVISGSVSSPSQGTISVGGFTNIDLGLQTGDNVTFNNITSTGNVVIQGNLTAQQFIVSSSVYFVTTSFSSGSTIFGNSLDDTHQFTGSIRVLGSITGSISSSNLVGDIILGTQTSGQYTTTITGGSGLTATSANPTDGTAYTIDVVAGAGISLTAPTNDAVNIDTGSTHFTTGVKNKNNTDSVLSGSVSSPSQGTISVGGFTNIDLGLQSGDNVTFNTVTATNGLTGSITASSLQGAILNTQLQNSSITVGNTNISLGGTATTITGLTSVTSTNFVGTASYVTGSIFTSTNQALSSSYALTASFALNAGGGAGFPFSGSAQITGSFGVTGSISTTGALTASLRQGYVWVGGSGNVTTLVPTSSLGAGGASGANAKLNQSVAATTWSFGHFLGDQYPNITVFDSNGAVIIPGRIETEDSNNLKVYFDAATAGTVVASVGGTATTINAQTASYFNGTELTVSTTTFTPEVTSSLGATTTTVSRVWTGSFSGAFWDYVVNNGANYRGGIIMGVWNKVGSAQFTDTSTPDIGDTSQLTFGVVINGEYAELRATTTTSGWNVKTFVRKI